MEKIHKTFVFMLSCIKHACFHVFSPFSAYFSPHDIIAEKGLLEVATLILFLTLRIRRLFVHVKLIVYIQTRVISLALR